MEELSAAQNRFASIDLSKNIELEEVDLKDNSLQEIDFSNNRKLTMVNVSINKLTQLDLSQCTNLKELYCFTNKIEQLHLMTNQELTTLSCGDNKLTLLDLSNLTKLESVSTPFNGLNSVKTAGCSKLVGIDLNHNQLDFTGCESLKVLDISFNKFTIEGTLKMIETLPSATADEKGTIVYTNKVDFPNEKEENQYAPILSEKANAKHWIMSDGESDLSVKEIITHNSTFALYPTLADKMVYIDGNYREASIFTMNGVLVGQLNGEESIDTSHWTEGTYIVKTKVGDKEHIAQFVVQH